MKRASAVFTALFLLSASAAFSQGNFLKKGQYGLGLSGAYATNSSASGFSGTAVVTLGGIFDLSFGAGHAVFDTAEFGDLTSNFLTPELRAHVIKQNSSKSPVSLSLSFGFAKDDFASPELEPAGIGAMWANSFVLGATVYRDVPLSGKLSLQPYVGVSHTSSTFKLTVISTGVTWSDKDGMAAFLVGLPVVYSFSERALLVLQPGLTFDKDATTFAVSLGLVYAFNKAPSGE
ncbi:MAG: hypothetical protein NTX99_11280 [Candidatus Aminicenantes bacterium]|nr:hypothetical protein [Candidatus Aminicenantes bacterium]